MSFTNETTHYGIPLPLGTDLTTPMDYNEAAQEVDTAIWSAVQTAGTATADAAEAKSIAQGAVSDVTALNLRVNGAEADIATLQQSDTTQDTAILNLQNRVTAVENKDIEVTLTDGTVGVFLNTIGALTAGTYLIGNMDGTIVVTSQGIVLASARLGDANGNIALFNIRNSAGTVFGRVDFNTTAGTTGYQCYTGAQGDAILTPFGTTIRLYRVH